MAKKITFREMLADLQNKSIDKPRDVETIEERKYYLIVCEGGRTEPLYFNNFKKRLPRNLLETIEINGLGDNTINVVRKAIELRNSRSNTLPKFDEVWAVFDKDDFPPEVYNGAIQLAADNDISCAQSNQSFELWYILHFQYLDTALHRTRYIEILSGILGYKYEKNSQEIIDFIAINGNQEQAIIWAKRLEDIHHRAGITETESCPKTRVYALVESLNKYIS